MIFIYRVLTIFLVFLPLISILRILKKKESLLSIRDKIGLFRGKPKKNLVWFHGSSVGEVLSIVPLVHELEKEKNRSNINYI